MVYILIPDSDNWYTKLLVTNPANNVVYGNNCIYYVLILVINGYIHSILIFNKCINLSHIINIPNGYFLKLICAYPYFVIFLPCFYLS